MTGLAAVNIEGARGVGKTRTAQHHARTFIPLDDPDERAQLFALGSRFLTDIPPPIVLDEWQRMPELWDRVRRAVDSDSTPGRFILTGSASPPIAPVHTGAGRIASLRMRPLSLAERDMAEPTVSLSALFTGHQDTEIHGRSERSLGDYIQEIVCSGFPGIRHLPPLARESQLDTYLAQTARHDIPGISSRRARTLTDWLRAYAASVSTTATFTRIAALASKGHDTTMSDATGRTYRDLLEGMWILDPVPGWTPSENEFARATAADKHQLCDPALAARLLHLGAASLLSVGRPAVSTGGTPAPRRMLGPLFEALVTQSVKVYSQLCDAEVRHLRTKKGEHEVDLIVEGADRRVVAIEIKSSATPNDQDAKHLLWLRDKLGDRLAEAMIITTGRYAYRDENGVAVVPAALLGP